MAKKNVSSLSWNDRLALIKHYNPSDSAICSALGVSTDELQTARDLENAGTFMPTPDLDVDAYSKLFGDSSIVAPKTEAKTESFVKPTSTGSGQPPATATKKVATPKKRGRKGDKIEKAFLSIPTTPVSAEQYAQDNGISLHVLRQVKRFTEKKPEVFKELGNVHVKKDKKSKTLMVWQEKK